MGRRTQKIQAGPSKDPQDMGEMLQRPMASKMAALPDTGVQRAKPPTNILTTGGADTPTTFLEALTEQDPQAPATKQDTASLLWELRQMSAADIDMVRTDVKAVEARTQATENTVLELQ
ncbi:Hypothetical predicted protein [Pelobates cultripes]|uniref:Uncharacterized protein n=1 Tax=Pelobates cultripes TaxID=61616 RepID=A0AAD1TM21_PELCU|nr:Hypothetical predicted protein [Pelobates cultripes]